MGEKANQSRRTSKPVKPPVPTYIDPNQRYTVPESSAILRQSVAKTYIDMRDGTLLSFKDGGRTYVHGSELIRRSRPNFASVGL